MLSFPVSLVLSPPLISSHMMIMNFTHHRLRRDLKSKMWMFGIKDYGSVMVRLQLSHCPGCISVLSSINSCWEQFNVSTPKLRRGTTPSTHFHFCASEALLSWGPLSLPASSIQSLALKSPLISVCMQMRMMMKRQHNGTLQRSKEQLSKHGSLPVWQICSRVPQKIDLTTIDPWILFLSFFHLLSHRSTSCESVLAICLALNYVELQKLSE